MFPYLSLSPTVSIPLLKQQGRGSDPRFTLGGDFKILRTYKSAAGDSAAVSNRDFLFKNRNTVGESPTSIRKVLRWESVISIGGAAGEQTANGDIWTWSRSLLFFVLSCCVQARADREMMMCERDISFFSQELNGLTQTILSFKVNFDVILLPREVNFEWL